MPNPPPGLSERQFRNALAQLEEIVGSEWVFQTDEDVALYRDAYSPLWGEEEERYASAAVAPTTVEEVQDIVRVANDFQLPPSTRTLIASAFQCATNMTCRNPILTALDPSQW